MHALKLSLSLTAAALLSSAVLSQDEGDSPKTHEATALVVIEEAPTYLIQANEVVVAPGKTIKNGQVLVKNGMILAVGETVTAPDDAIVVQGETVCAGFMDAWSSLGIDPASVAEMGTGATTETASAVDHFTQDHFRVEARNAGVLLARSQVGKDASIGGLGAVLATSPAGAVVLDDACLSFTCGITRSGRRGDVFDRISEADSIGSRIASGIPYRQSLVEYSYELAEWDKAIAEKEEELADDFKKAKKDRDKEIEKAEEKGKEFKEDRYKEDKRPQAPRLDPDKAVFARAAHGEIPVIVEVHGTQELRALLASTADLPRLRLVLLGATHAMPFAEQLAARRIPVIVRPMAAGQPAEPEFKGHDLGLAGRLEGAGVQVLIGSGGSVAGVRDLPVLAQMAVAHGLSEKAAFEALTIGAARADIADISIPVEVGVELIGVEGVHATVAGVADAVDEPPTRAFREAMNVPELGLPEIDAADLAALEALHKAGAAMMVPKKKKGWTWTKGRGLGLTGETVGSSHVAALYGGGLLQSHRYQAMAAGLAERLAKTRKIGAAAKLRIVEAGKRHLKHIAPRKMIKNITRPQAMAAVGSLLAGVALAAGGRDRLAAAAKAGLKLAAFRDVLGSRGAPIDDAFEEVEGPEVEDGVLLYPQTATRFSEGGLGSMDNKPRRAVKPGLRAVAPKRKARPKTLDAMTMAEKNAAGYASSHGAGLTGMKRLPGACRSGKCDHAAHLRFSNALG